MSKGFVSLVGAGPGDPGLITVKALDCIRTADTVVYDFLANPQFLRGARPDAEIICVGKRGGHHTLRQPEINALLVKLGNEGKRICRLKGGDPFVFGRGGEEALELAEA
ncbi:HemD protein, partial [bacterium]|nr:HemD protein [bacterium]